MRTELRVVDAVAEFVVVTERLLFQERLVKMGWHPTGDAEALVRQLDASGDVERIIENFSRHVREMVLQSARLVPVRWEDGLAAFLDRVQGTGLGWWLYGSGALAVRGLDIEPGDVDIAVDDATLAGDLLADLLVEPVTRHRRWVADWSGRAFHGAIIEWLADAHPSGHSLPHEQEPAAIEHLETVLWHGRPVPVPTLHVQLATANRRGLRDRAGLIKAAIR